MHIAWVVLDPFCVGMTNRNYKNNHKIKMRNHNYFIYITTNPGRTVLYVGVTRDLYARMQQHAEDNINEKKTFAGKFFCYNLIYWERFQYIQDAIAREKEIKGWRREKKVDLIATMNPTWDFLNDTL